MACIAVKPVVDGLEREFQDNLRVIRVDIQSRVGRRLSPDFQAYVTPTFILFDHEGNEIWRVVGRLNPLQVRDAIRR